MLAVGGKSNSLGLVDDVIAVVLQDKSRMEELYDCLFVNDAWVRMRAADALEKICRQHPDWLTPYVDRFQAELAESSQPSIQWHIAQMYAQIDLTDPQKQCAMRWLSDLLSTTEVDWIVSANAMDTLAKFTQDGVFSRSMFAALLDIQKRHHSKSVVRRALKHEAALTAAT